MTLGIFTEHLTCERLFSIFIIGDYLMDAILLEFGWTIATALLLGGVTTIGMLALPWTPEEHQETMEAWKSLGTLVGQIVRPNSSPIAIPTSTPPIRRRKTTSY
jgi:hypothetical protein